MIQIVKENLGFRKQIVKLSKSELIKTYKGAALGPLWAVIKPAIQIFVFWFAFQVGLRNNRPVHGFDFFIFLLVGMIPWFFMNESILEGARCIRHNKHFVTKTPFPVGTIMTYTSLSHLYIHFVLVAIMYVILLFSGVMPSIYNIQILFYMPMMYAFFTCLSWITAPLSAISKDFENVVRSVINAIFWLSGIIWDQDTLGNGITKHILQLNPVNYFANGYRNTFLYKRWFWETPYETVCFLAILAGVFFLGAFVYRRLRKTIPDVL